jgi:hypothetical protein
MKAAQPLTGPARRRCPDCDRLITVTVMAGKLRVHWRDGAHCPGSGKAPA